jgi:hypothetical protein
MYYDIVKCDVIAETQVFILARIGVQKLRADKLEAAIKKICPTCETR